MAISNLARLCIVGSDKGGTADLAQEPSPEGAVLRELQTLAGREGAGPQEEEARKCLLASGIMNLGTIEELDPQKGHGEGVAWVEETLPEGLNPRPLFSYYPYQILAWMRRRGERLPCVFLPVGVQWGAQGRHDEVYGVLGETGVQLCRDNSAWARLLADCEVAAAEQSSEEDLPAWEDASPSMRGFLLRRLRGRDPKAGRELAEPLLRTQFHKYEELLYEFLIGLSVEDMPLLEACSQKQKKSLELNPATVLLSLLPESELSKQHAEEQLFVWKGKKLMPTEEANRQGVLEMRPNGSLMATYSLDWWLAQTGMGYRELLPFLFKDSAISSAIGGRILLEGNRDWLRAALDVGLEEASGTNGARSGLGFFGTLAAVMLPQEEVERRLLELLRYEGDNHRACDALAAPMLVYAPFALSREICQAYIEAIHRRAEAFQEAAAAGKDSEIESSWGRSFSALWAYENERDDKPQFFSEWTRWRFRGTGGVCLILYHLAWLFPPDLLEALIDALTLPSDCPLFERERRRLGDILQFRARAGEA